MALISMISKVQPEPNIYVESLKTFGHTVECFSQPTQCVAQSLRRCPDIIVLELCRMDQSAGLILLSDMERLRLTIPVVILSSPSQSQLAQFANVVVVESDCLSAFINVVEELVDHMKMRPLRPTR